MYGMHGRVQGKARENATLKTSAKGRVYIQFGLLVPNGRDLLGYPALKVVRVIAFEEVAIALAKKIYKGATVRAEGAIKFERWNDREGYQRTCLTVIASKVEKLGAPEFVLTSAEAKPAFNNGKKTEKPKPRSRKNLAELMLTAAGR